MELIPKEIADKIPKLYETENTDPIVYVKLFTFTCVLCYNLV